MITVADFEVLSLRGVYIASLGASTLSAEDLCSIKNIQGMLSQRDELLSADNISIRLIGLQEKISGLMILRGDTSEVIWSATCR